MTLMRKGFDFSLSSDRINWSQWIHVCDRTELNYESGPYICRIVEFQVHWHSVGQQSTALVRDFAEALTIASWYADRLTVRFRGMDLTSEEFRNAEREIRNEIEVFELGEKAP